MIFGLTVKAPDLQGQLLPGQHLASIGDEIFQNVIFLFAEPHTLPISRAGQCEGSGVQGNIAKGKDPVGSAQGAPPQCPKPCQKLSGHERLGQIIVCTAVKTRDLVVQLPLGGKHQNGHTDSLAPNRFCDVIAIHSGKHHIQNHNIIDPGFDGSQTVQSVGKMIHLIFFQPQELTQRLGHSFFILHQQYPHGNTSYRIQYSIKA